MMMMLMRIQELTNSFVCITVRLHWSASLPHFICVCDSHASLAVSQSCFILSVSLSHLFCLGHYHTSFVSVAVTLHLFLSQSHFVCLSQSHFICLSRSHFICLCRSHASFVSVTVTHCLSVQSSHFSCLCHSHALYAGLPIFSLSRGYLHPFLEFLGSIFHPLFINFEGITACSKC